MGGKKRDRQKEVEQRRQQRKDDRDIKKKLHRKKAKVDAFKLSRQYVQFFNKFNKEISVFKIELRDVGGDGNCLFRAFADQIDGKEEAHVFMRQEACRHIMENQEFFKPFLDQDEDGSIGHYVKGMSKEGEWGGHLELQALSECFRCVMVIHKINLEEVVIKPITQQPEGGLVHLAYFQNEDFEHYLSIRDINDGQGEQPASIKLAPLNKNIYERYLYEDEDEWLMIKQVEEMQIRQKKLQQMHEAAEYYQQQQEPYPNYPRNKKCKCGSKLQYKNCCFKEFQRRRAQKGY